MPIRHPPVAATAVLAILALAACVPVVTAPARYDTGEPASKTLASATIAPANARGGSQIIDGFIVDTGPPQPVDPRGRYYVEFRSRWLALYGHTYVVYGRLDADGKPLDRHFVALYPRGGYLGLAAGSLPIMVPATTLPVWGDSEFDTLTVYRRPIKPAQYEKIENFVYQTRSHANSWNLYTINCNYFAGEIAALVGLKVPPLSAQVAPLYVKEIELLNEKS
jgi:hypothetical protein